MNSQFRPPIPPQQQQNKFSFPPQSQPPPFGGQQNPSRPNFPVPGAQGTPPNFLPPPINRMPNPPHQVPQHPGSFPPHSSPSPYNLPNSFPLVQQQLHGKPPPLPPQQRPPQMQPPQMGASQGVPPRPQGGLPQPFLPQQHSQQQPQHQQTPQQQQYGQQPQPSLSQQLHINMQMKLSQGSGQVPNFLQGQPGQNQQQPPQQQQVSPFGQQDQEQDKSKPEQEGGKHEGGEKKGEWSVHTANDGRKYYYNQVTHKSVWHRPVELMTETEKHEAQNNWKEYNSKDGRKYYYNRATKESRWDIPDELKKQNAQNEQAAPPQGGNVNNGTQPVNTDAQAGVNVSTPAQNKVVPDISKPEINSVQKEEAQVAVTQQQTPTAKVEIQSTPKEVQNTDANKIQLDQQQSENKSKFQYATKAEAKEAFKKMFLDAQVGSETKWEDAFKQVETDRRFNALVTEKEKRQCYQEYQQNKRQLEKDEIKKKEIELERQHIEYIVSMDHVKPSMRPKYILPIVQKESRFQDFKEEKLEEMINEALILKEKRLKEEEEQDIKIKMDIFKKLLEKQGHIKVSTTWGKIKDKFTGYKEFEDLEKVDAIKVFMAISKEVEKTDEAKQEKEKQGVLRIERQNRDIFKYQLKELRESGEIHAKSRWPEVYKLVKKEGPYKSVESNLYGSRPKELFEDLLEEMEVQFEKDKAEMKAFIKSNGVPLSVDMTLEQFVEQLNQGSEELQAVSLTNKNLYFEEISNKVKEKEAKEQKKQKKARDALQSFYKHQKYNESTEWEQVLPLVKQSEEFQAVGDELSAQKLFQEYQEHVAQKNKEKLKKKKQREQESSSQDVSMDDQQRSYDSGEDISEISTHKRKSSQRAHKRHREQSEEMDDKGKKSKKSKKTKDKKEKKSRKQKYEQESSGEYGNGKYSDGLD